MTRLVRVAVKATLLAALAVVVYLGVTLAQVVLESRHTGPSHGDAIVVLGAAQYNGQPSSVLRARLDHAAALWRAHAAPVIMLTGGRQGADAFTEASAGEAYLLRQGIPETALLLESSGANSWQSLAAAARVLRQRSLLDVLLVSSPYHALRTEHIATEVGLHGHASPTRTSPESRSSQVRHFLHETVAVAVGRVVGYGRLVRLDQSVTRVRSGSGAG